LLRTAGIVGCFLPTDFYDSPELKMRLSVIILILISSFASAQTKEPWDAFWDKEHYLKGFKDKNGTVRIEPKFMGLTTALKFKNIIAVMEEQNGKHLSYYLLKNGNKVGMNNSYIGADMNFDCESEGKIRFRDRKSDKVGYYDSRGHIVIPAAYSDALPFRNDVAIALRNAKRICWEGGELSEKNYCEHWRWKGGTSLLIDTKNNVLIENFKYNSEIDLYSLKISTNSHEDPLREYFPGKNGKYYSFINVKKDFESWILNKLVNNLSREKLEGNTYKEVTYWRESDGWISKKRADFLNLNCQVLESKLLEIGKIDADYSIFIDGLNPFIYKNGEYKKYFDDCGKPKIWRYPVVSVITNHKSKNDYYQNQFNFLKTDEGYRLLSLTIRNVELK
jgi:hypothetical protein